MSSNQSNTTTINRTVGGTEYSWCRAVPGGTGITVVTLLLSKSPDLQILQNALRNLQSYHPILNSTINPNASTLAGKTFSLLSLPSPAIRIETFDAQSTAGILSGDDRFPLRTLLEHELNVNAWEEISGDDVAGDSRISGEVFFASVYELAGGEKFAVALRLHTAICDRTAAAALLRGLVMEIGESGAGMELAEPGEGSLGIEDLIPKGKGNKVFWARGIDMLGYSLNAFRLTNLEFSGPSWPRSSRVVRLRIGQSETLQIVDGCKSREIKLSSALAAAALIAARNFKNIPKQQREKYGVVTLIDCRSILEPPLSNNHLGFYHSAILNTHDINGEESLWSLAERLYTSLANAKNSNKHFSDMSDLNFLMCRAIENPGLTPSSSLRTAFISVFEDPLIDQKDEKCEKLGLEDYIGCSSVHGVGPSIAVFDTIRDGSLDCALVYPSPLHSRDQMEEIVEEMKRVLVDCCTKVESGN